MQTENEQPFNKIDQIVNRGLNNIKEMLKIQTFVGEAIEMGKGCSVFPVIKLTVGMVNGGGEYSAKKIRKYASYPFVGAMGAGVCAEPIAFIINNNGDVKLKTIEAQNVGMQILKKLADAAAKYVEKMYNK